MSTSTLYVAEAPDARKLAPSAGAWHDRAASQYGSRVWRDRILHDLILADAERLGRQLTFLDIGCGRGFDTDLPLQQSLIRAAGNYIGVEPDSSIACNPDITDLRRRRFEEVSLPANSVNIAFSVMVLEHIAAPAPFWEQLYDVLAPGGVFWAMTVDARHWTTIASWSLERAGLKELYLRALGGMRGADRYENYPVYYRCNTPRQLQRYARRFTSLSWANLCRVGQADGYLPFALRPLARAGDALARRYGWPGSLLLIRAMK